jgi:PilZ domain-containing protein
MRAARFPLHLRVRYRRAEDRTWRRGVTENISHSGALVRVDESLQVDTVIEVRLVFPAAPARRKSSEVACRGRVVRTVPPDGDETRPGIAVAIDEYDFLPAAVDSSHVLTL